jgi:hypothetical protein
MVGIVPGRIRRFFRAGASFGLPREDEVPTEDRRDRPTTAPAATGLAPDRRWPLCLYLTIVKIFCVHVVVVCCLLAVACLKRRALFQSLRGSAS